MKHNILIMVTVLFCGVAFGQQETYVSETGGENNPIIYVDQGGQETTPCGENNESNAFENGKSCTHSFGRIVANDFTVPEGEYLTLESMLLNVFMGAEGSGVNAAFIDVYYYSDNNGQPGGVIGGEFSVFPNSQSVVGSNFGFDVWQIELDVTDRVFYDQGSSPRTYWIGISIEATDGSNVFWENSTVGLIGSGEAYDDGLVGFVTDATLEGVYFITADCQLRLGIDDNFAAQVQVYPNPVTDGVVTINSPFSVEKQVIVFDMLGKKVIETELLENQLDLTSLQSGVYLLQLTQEGNSVTKKVVIQ